MQTWINRIFMENGSLKLIAFILTLSLFLWVREDRGSAVSVQVPIRLIIPEGTVLVSEPVDRIRATVGGRRSDLSNFDPAQIAPIRLEVDRDTSGLVSIDTEMIDLPPGLKVTSIQPNFVKVELEPALAKSVEIRARRVGDPGESFDLGEIKLRPKQITISGPRSKVETLEWVWTEPIDVTGRTETFEKRVQLRIDDPLLQYNVDTTITAQVPVTTQEVTRTVQEVAVRAVNTTYAAEISPKSVNVTVRGPKPIVDKLAPTTIQAIVDLVDEGQPGTFMKQAKITSLPPDVNLVQSYPTDFIVTTKRVAPVPTPDPTPNPGPQEAPEPTPP